MKVCYVMATTDLNGGARSLLDLIDCDIKNDIDVLVIINKEYKELEEILRNKKIKYKKFLYRPDVVHNNPLKTFLKIIMNKFATIRLCSFLKKEKVDIVHNNSVISLIGMKAAYKANIPYVCHIRELIEDGLNVKMINYKQLYNCLKRSNATICISKFVENKYKNNITLSKNHTFFDGIKTEEYRYIRKFGNYKNNIIMVGTYFPQKGQIDALKALNILVNEYNLKDIKLTFVGDISDEEYYDELVNFTVINRLENNVIFKNFNSNLKKFRQKNDIALVCSSNEAMGRVTPEAMLANELVIGANAGGTKYIIKSGTNGYLYELNNPYDLADKIKFAIENTKDVEKVVSNGFEYAMKNFDNNIQSQKVIDIYYEIIKNRKEHIS